MMVQEERDLSKLKDELVKMWERVLKVEGVGVDEDFFSLGGDSLAVVRFTNLLQERLGEVVNGTVVLKMPTIAQLVRYLADHYEDAVASICGHQMVKPKGRSEPGLTDEDIAGMRTLLATTRPSSNLTDGQQEEIRKRRKNPRAVFILSPPRSGSTLLRVMLAGHRDLFAPPELVLLPFYSLKARKTVFSGPISFWREGAIRAIMEMRQCDGDQAKAIMDEYEEKDLSVQELYGLMQEWIDGRMLVDKSPMYAMHRNALSRAEQYFDNPLYIHLLRHPHAMIKSFEDVKLDQLAITIEHNYSSRQLAELVWLVSHQNILDFLTDVPKQRQCRVSFEELVREPRAVTENICEFLKVGFQEEVLSPYQDQRRKMTDGPHSSSRMMGDRKFHQHKNIDPKMADRWKQADSIPSLSNITWKVAESLGYERPSQ